MNTRLTMICLVLFFCLQTCLYAEETVTPSTDILQPETNGEAKIPKSVQGDWEYTPPALPEDPSGMETPDPAEAESAPRLPAVFLPRRVFPDNIRQPSGAELLYPADKPLVYRLLSSLDRAQALPPVPGLAKTFIAPWGSIDGGLATAAKVYQYLRSLKGLKTIVLLSRAHRRPLIGCSASVWPEGGYATPIGITPINALGSQKLLKNKLFGFDHEAHMNELSIETHVLLIQYFLPNVQIVPVLINPRNKEELESISNSLAGLLSGKSTVMIGISNLSYGIPTAEQTGSLDLKTISSISTMDLNVINNTVKKRAEGLPPEAGVLESPPTIMTTILTSLLLEEDTITWLGYNKNRQIPGRPLMTGFVAGAISERAAVDWNDSQIAAIMQRETGRLSTKAVKEMLQVARDSLESAAVMARYDTPYPVNAELLKKRALFVTAYTPNGKVLASMGSTGTAARICNAVSEAARMCAVGEDPQQSHRLTSDQAYEAEVVVSIFKDFKTIGRWDEVKTGMGVVIARGGSRSLVLPITAKRNNWGVEEMLSFACRQAGLRPDAYRSDKIDIFTFYTDDYISPSRDKKLPTKPQGQVDNATTPMKEVEQK